MRSNDVVFASFTLVTFMSLDSDSDDSESYIEPEKPEERKDGSVR